MPDVATLVAYLDTTGDGDGDPDADDDGWDAWAVHGTVHDILADLAADPAGGSSKVSGYVVDKVVAIVLEIVARDDDVQDGGSSSNGGGSVGGVDAPAASGNDSSDTQKETGANDWQRGHRRFQVARGFFEALQEQLDNPAALVDPSEAASYGARTPKTWMMQRLGQLAWLCRMESRHAPMDVQAHDDDTAVATMAFYAALLRGVQQAASILQKPPPFDADGGGGGDDGDVGGGAVDQPDPARYPVLLPGGVANAVLGDVCTDPRFGIHSAAEREMVEHVGRCMSIDRAVGPAIDLFRYLHGCTARFASGAATGTVAIYADVPRANSLPG